MSKIVPTITASNPHIYREEIERVSDFASRIHIDLADGIFAPTKLINPIQAWWPEDKTADIHVMYENPSEHLDTLVSLKPSLIIFHAESKADVGALINKIQDFGISAGVALLEDSSPDEHKKLLIQADHALVFGGKLGYHGGQASLENLDKVKAIKQINPQIEISWDGGINDRNISLMHDAGVDVFNVGGFIQKADKPQDAYDILEKIIKQ